MKLLWLDMEMTGLDVEKERVIEVACIVTDKNWKELGTYEAIVKQPESFLDGMDEWNTKQHGKSGLTEAVKNGKEPEIVEKELMDFVNQHWRTRERPILAGNSIHQDRKFIDKYFVNLEKRLHYRLLDVSAFKVVYESWHNIKYKKKEGHRAMGDIRESIAELRYYLSFVKPD